MTAQMLYAVLTIEHEFSDGRANAIITKAMTNGDYLLSSRGILITNTNSGMPAEFRIESVI